MAIKYICMECKWQGTDAEIDYLKDPKSKLMWQICRKCRSPDRLSRACDEPDCWSEATRGTMQASLYRQTCALHRPR